MNALQFQVALLEAQQRARLAIGSFMEAMTPPQLPQMGQGVQDASNTNIDQGLQDQENGLGGNGAEPGNVPPGNVRQPGY